MVKKNDVIQLRIEEIKFPNKGIGTVDGNKVIVKNTIPGQLVLTKITKKRSSAIEGRVEEVIEKSPIEIVSECSHFGLCGGCAYQNISHENELILKEKQVLKLLDDAGIKEYKYEGIVAAPNPKGYRNKCEFSFGDEEKGGKLALGMRKRQSYYEVVTLKDCNIVDGDYLKIIESVLHFFQKRKTPFYHKTKHEGILRHLVVRKGAYTGEILINIVTTKEINFSVEEFKNELLELKLEGKICGILHTANDGVADIVKSDETKVLFGKDYFMEKLFNLDFKVSAFSFFQTNTKGAEKLYTIVKDFVGNSDNKIIFDLYCGTGTISQILAEKSKCVYGIEIVEEAIDAAHENAILNNITNCKFIAGDVLKKIDELEEKPDIIIVDPPREGIHAKAIGKIIDFGAPEIVYVSCKPTSLARDLQVFEENGYKVKRVKCMDQFSRTTHVETIIMMTYCGDKAKNKG